MKEGYVCISNTIFSTLLASTESEQSIGLMYQPWPPPVMTFIYDQPKINKFWMHNTPSPLDIIFCCKGKITQICYGEPFSTRIIGEDKYSDLVIELPHGEVNKMGIKIGHSVDLIK